MEDPLWNQARALASDLSAGKYKFRGTELRYVKAKELLERFDPLQKEAERIVLPFATEYFQGERPQGFTKVREYTNEHNVFDIAHDPLAPNSIVVVRPFRKDPSSGKEVEDGRASVYWISPQKWPGKDLPFVFQLSAWWTIDNNYNVKGVSNGVFCFDWNDPIMESDRPIDLFSCAWPMDEKGVRYGRSEIDVWHKGTTRPEKRRDPVKERSAVNVLNPSPSGI